jgi:hypothetical protein
MIVLIIHVWKENLRDQYIELLSPQENIESFDNLESNIF